MNFCCPDIENYLLEGEVAIYYSPKFRRYGIKILDGGNSTQLIRYCPWCGTKLPEELSDKFFEAIAEVLKIEKEDVGLDDLSNPDLPDEFKSDEWWLKLKL